MARSVLSWRTTKGGMPSFLAMVVRQALRACSSCSAAGLSSAGGVAVEDDAGFLAESLRSGFLAVAKGSELLLLPLRSAEGI